MGRRFLLKGVSAVAFCALFAACSHDVDLAAEQQATVEEFTGNFETYVMGGQAINPEQTWTTATTTTVKVSVNLDYDAEYNVYIYQSAPLIDKDAAFIGHVALKSGETKEVAIARPTSATLLYAACYDKNMHAVVKDFAVVGNAGEVAFGEPRVAATRGFSTGYRWSVAQKAMPDLTTFTTGTLYEMQVEFNTNGAGLPVNQADGSEKHLKITGTYSGSIARIQSYDRQSVYVTGTWTVPTDQRCTGNSVIVVGNGGKIIIPSGHMLSTNANNEAGTTGMIYVMPGGSIEGDGQLQFSNGTQTYSYNAGNINVADLNINGGVLYNAGTIGDTKAPALTGPAGTPDNPSKFINAGNAKFASTGGAGLSIENACNLEVVGLMELGNTSKMDNGSYIKCGQLKLAGSNHGGIVFLMGENAYLRVTEKVAGINNFGMWGPNTGNNVKAFLEVPYNFNERAINWTDDMPSTFCLDNVCAVLPDDYEIVDLSSNPYHQYIYNPRGIPASALLLTWMNAKKENGNGYNGVSDANLDGHTRSCTWSKSVTVTPQTEEGCGATVSESRDPNPQQPDPETPEVPATTNWVYYAFEDLGGTKDFDFNDVVLRVSTPVNNVSKVYILAAGGELNSIVTLDGAHFGQEVHAAIGAPDHTITNTKSASVSTSSFKLLGEVTLQSGQTPATLPFGLDVLNNDGTSRNVIASRINGNMSVKQDSYGKAPLYLIINGDANGKWFWPRELSNITTVFKGFTSWGATLNENTTWYMPANADDAKVVKW